MKALYLVSAEVEVSRYGNTETSTWTRIIWADKWGDAVKQFEDHVQSHAIAYENSCSIVTEIKAHEALGVPE